MALTLADEVGGLEIKCQRVVDLAAEVIATLKLNKHLLCPDNFEARSNLFDLIDRWEKVLAEGWDLGAWEKDRAAQLLRS